MFWIWYKNNEKYQWKLLILKQHYSDTRADYHVKLWLSWYFHYQRNPYHYTFTIKGLISRCIMILSVFTNQCLKTGLPVKIPNITASSNISFATILTNIFAKQKSFLFSYFVNLNKKAAEWYYRRRKCTETKTIKTIDSWWDYWQ